MLSLPPRLASGIRPVRHWKIVSAAEAARLIRPDTTIGVGWLSDTLAAALVEAFRTDAEPSGLTIMYATTHGEGRTHGLNLLAHDGLVRRVIGGQWHPVPALQALAVGNRIEAYSLPVGVIHWLFREIAEGHGGHLSRSGLGTFTDPRNGGGRLNTRTREQLVRLVRPAGEEALLFRGFPIDVAVIGVGFMAGTAAPAMTRDALAIARAARRSGGIVIAQVDRIGTLDRLPPGHIEVPDSLVDILVESDPRDRMWETFGLLPTVRPAQRLLTH